MRSRGDDEALWRRLDLLGGIEWPRVVHWQPEAGDSASQRRTSFAMLGQDWFFQRPDVISTILDRVRRQLDLDSDTWRAQRDFLAEFARGSFRSTDRPAWVQLLTERKGFGRLMADEGRQRMHAVQLGEPAFRVRDLRRSPVAFAGERVRLARFSPAHPSDQGDALRLQRIYVHRSIRVNNRWLTEMHERLITVSGDPEDLQLASRGFVPVLERLRDHDDVHRSPVLSFFRLDEDNKVSGRIVSLCPDAGFICDVRACTDEPEYYFRSSMHYHDVLCRLALTNEHEAF